MSPIIQASNLGRIIAIENKLTKLLNEIRTIKNALSPTSYNLLLAKVTFKLLPTTITKINKLWTTYFKSIPVSSINQDEQQLDSTIANINTRGANIKNLIKNITINDLTLDFISINLDDLTNQTSTAISQVAKLVSILDIGDRIAQASNRRQHRSLPPPPLSPLSPVSPSLSLSSLPPPPPPFSAPPRLQRQSNLGTPQRGLVRQQATHSLLDLDGLDGLDDLRLAEGKKFFKQRRLTHRNKLRGRKSRKHYKTRKA